MSITRGSRKPLLAIGLALSMLFSLGGLAGAAANQGAAGDGSSPSFDLDVYALRESAIAKLYVTVLPADNQTNTPDVLKKIQVKITGADGQLLSTTNYNDVASPGGKAILDLGDVPLLDTVAVQVLIQTKPVVRTEVLNGNTAVTEFAVQSRQTVVSGFEGYGAQMNMHLYTSLNDPARGFTHNDPPADLANVESKVKALKPGLVRIFLSPANYQSGNENRMDSFIKTVELAQQAGAAANITWWFIQRAPATHPEQQQTLMQQDMRHFADTLIDLVKNRGLTTVQEITIQNEVNTSWVKPELYEQYYRLLDQYLRDAGIRDHIRFVGGDLVFNNQLTWFTYMADHMGDVLDGWSVHIYWNYWDTAYMQKRLSDIRAIYDAISSDKRKPLSITEYGTRGIKYNNNNPKDPIKDVNPYRNGALTATLAGHDENGAPISETNINAFQQAWFNMLAANTGFSGLAKWDMYRAQYDFSYQDYSLIGYNFNPAPGEDRWPLRPSYYVQQLMASTTVKNWSVLGYAGSSGAKLITPFQGPSGEQTLFALNTDGNATSFSIGDLPANTEYRVLIWNGDGSGATAAASSINSGAAGSVTFDAPAGSMVALTTVPMAP